jgi:hypothetical protein
VKGIISNTSVADLVSRNVVLKQIEELRSLMLDVSAHHGKTHVPPLFLLCYDRSPLTTTRERNIRQLDFQIQQHSKEVRNSLVDRNRVLLANIKTPKLDCIIYLLVQLVNKCQLRIFSVLKQAVKKTTSVLSDVAHYTRSAAQVIDTLSLSAGIILMLADEVIKQLSEQEGPALEPDTSALPVHEHDCSETLYGNIQEVMSSDLPEPLGNTVVLVSYVDAKLQH